ncbi:hypothetical protein A7L51_19435 [Acinetobacter baumannii]|nr:hypothetical protein A7L51_19435 [Acinetobacter baumannii]
MRGALGSGGLRRCGHGVALSEASLATITAVQSLVLEVVLGAAVAGRGAAAVEEAVCTGARAGDTTLSAAADIDFRDCVGKAGGGGGTGLCGSGLHSCGRRLALG